MTVILDPIFIEIIIMLIVAWFFEEKIIPQIIIMFLTIWIAITNLDAGADWKAVLIFAAVIIYSAFQIYGHKENNGD